MRSTRRTYLDKGHAPGGRRFHCQACQDAPILAALAVNVERRLVEFAFQQIGVGAAPPDLHARRERVANGGDAGDTGRGFGREFVVEKPGGERSVIVVDQHTRIEVLDAGSAGEGSPEEQPS